LFFSCFAVLFTLVMRKALLIFFLLSGLWVSAQPRPNLDSILVSLNNNDLYVGAVIGGICFFPQKQPNPYPPRPMFIVSSLDVDIRELAKKYSTKTVSEKLIALLDDSTRDFYANALLYDLLENRKLGKLLFMKREEWIYTGKKPTDIQYWKQYILECTPDGNQQYTAL
jgi:hypothetical protein